MNEAMTQSDVGQKLAGQMARREKHWEELNDAEKIERMHMVVRQQQDTIQRLEQMAYSMQVHQHGAQGELLVPANYGGALQGGNSIGNYVGRSREWF